MLLPMVLCTGPMNGPCLAPPAPPLLRAPSPPAASSSQVEEMTELHLCLMRCFVFPDLEAAQWGKWNKYHNDTRCSNTVAFWQLHVKACLQVTALCRPWLNIGQEVLAATLVALCARYSALKPTKVCVWRGPGGAVSQRDIGPGGRAGPGSGGGGG